MRDTVDINELQDHLQREKNANWWAWVIAVVIAAPLFGLFFLLLLTLFVVLSGDLATALAAVSIPIIFILLWVYFIVAGIAKGINNYRIMSYRLKVLREANLFVFPNRPFLELWVRLGEIRKTLVSVGITFLLIAISSFIGIPFLLLLALYYGPILLYNVFKATIFQSFIIRPFRNGRPEVALQRIRFWKRIFRRMPELWGLETLALMTSGQVAEALQLMKTRMRQALQTFNIELLTILLNDWGYYNGLIGRYETGIRYLSLAIKARPDVGAIYDSLAVCYVEKGVYPRRASELCQLAQENTPKAASPGRAVQMATFARALAQEGETPSAILTMEDALQLVVHPNVQGEAFMLSEAYRQLAHVKWITGDTLGARAFFEESIRKSPQGLFAILAKRDLKRLDDEETESVLEKAAAHAG